MAQRYARLDRREFDYSEMNALLSGFLDAMVEEYRREHCATVSQVMEKMIAFSDGNIHDIDHLIRVWTYAKTIGDQTGTIAFPCGGSSRPAEGLSGNCVERMLYRRAHHSLFNGVSYGSVKIRWKARTCDG